MGLPTAMFAHPIMCLVSIPLEVAYAMGLIWIFIPILWVHSVCLPYGNADVKVVNMYGKTVEQRILNNFNRTSLEFDPSAWMTGVYLIVVRSSLNASVVRKFAKY